MTMTYGLKKTIGLSKSSAKDSRDAKDSRLSRSIQPERKSLGRLLIANKSGKLQPISEKRDGNEDTYSHGVVDLWLQQNATRAMSPPRRRHPRKSKRQLKPTGDTSVITEMTI